MHHFNFEEKKLIEKYFDNKCTREELDQLLQIIENNEGEEELTQIFKSYWEKSGEKQTFTDTNLDSKFSTLLKEVKYEAPVVPMNMRKKKRSK